MLNFIDTVGEAVAGIEDGSTVMIGGFGNAGQPFELIDALMDCGATDLTVVNNNAGMGGFFTPTGYGTMLAEGKETRFLDGKWQVFETPIHADVALIKALKADGKGNLVYRKTARNFGPIMAAAAKQSIVQVSEIVPTGALDPENVVTPGIYVNSIVKVA